MFEIKITVSCPDLVLAATALAKCLHPTEEGNVGTVHASGETAQLCHKGKESAGACVKVPKSTMPTPTVQRAPEATTNVPTIPVASTALVSAPAGPVVPMAAPVPLAAAPQYTMDQIARAGADLVTRDPSKANAAQQLLASFGIQSVTALPQERYGEFATALRGLGAQI